MSPDAADDAVRCDCGEPLFEGIDRNTVSVNGEELVYRRTTDFVLCGACGAFYTIAHVRSDALKRPPT